MDGQESEVTDPYREDPPQDSSTGGVSCQTGGDPAYEVVKALSPDRSYEDSGTGPDPAAGDADVGDRSGWSEQLPCGPGSPMDAYLEPQD